VAKHTLLFTLSLTDVKIPSEETSLLEGATSGAREHY
jgi:hypothetical protein